MPVVGDASVLNPEEIGSDEGDRLTLVLRLAKPAGEMAGEPHVYRHVVACDDHLLHRQSEIGQGGTELPRGEGPSGPCGRPGGKVWSMKFSAMACFSKTPSPVFQNS